MRHLMRCLLSQHQYPRLLDLRLKTNRLLVYLTSIPVRLFDIPN